MKNIAQVIAKNGLLLIFFPLFLIVFSLVWICPVFQSSDDAWQSLMNAGYVFWDFPMVNPIITSPGFTSIVVVLNTYFPFYSWHGIVLLFCHYMIVLSIFRILLEYQSKFASMVILTLYFFIVHINFIAFLHYTATGILMGCLALIVIFIKNNRNWADLKLGGFLFLFGSFLRPEAAIFSILLVCWVFVQPILKKNYSLFFLQIKKLTLLVVLTLAVNLFFYLATNTHGQWNNYLSFHYRYAKPLLDNDYLPYSQKTAALYNSIGWSENDYNMLTNWYFGDTVTFNYKKIAELYSSAKLSSEISSLRSWNSGIEEINFHFRQSQYFQIEFLSLLLVSFMLCWHGFKQKSMGDISKILPFLLTAIAFIVYLAFFMKLPPWVIQPIVAIEVILILVHFPKSLFISNLVKKPILLLPLSVIVVVILFVYHKRGMNERAKFETFKDFITALKPKSTDLYWITTDFPITNIPALADFRFLKDLKGYPTTTICQTPFAFERMVQRNIGNPSVYLFENPQAKALCSEKFCIMYKTYVKEHFDKNIEYSNTFPFEKFGNTFGVYIFKENHN